MNVGIPMAWTAYSQTVSASALILAAGTWSYVFLKSITSLLSLDAFNILVVGQEVSASFTIVRMR